MKKPKPLFKRTTHKYQRADGSIWITTAKPGTNMGPGTKWIKEHHHKFQVFQDADGVTVFGSSLDNPSADDIDRIIDWYKDVKAYIKSRNLR